MSNVHDLGDQLNEVTVPVKINGKMYTIHEARGDAVIRFRNAQMQTLEMKNNQVSGLRGGAGVDVLLISLCLSEDENGKYVPQHEVKKYKNSSIKWLFEKIKEISELQEEEDTVESLQEQMTKLQERLTALQQDAVGNALEATEVGCDSQPISVAPSP